MTRRLRRAVHPGDAERTQQTLVTPVYSTRDHVIGVNVWARSRNDAVLVLGRADMELVGRELLRLAAEIK